MELLLERSDIDPNLQDLEGNTPLILTIVKGHFDHFMLLVNDSRVDHSIRNMAYKNAYDYARDDIRFSQVLPPRFSCNVA